VARPHFPGCVGENEALRCASWTTPNSRPAPCSGFRTTSVLFRVLVRDADAVMYDCWWPHLDGWGLADLKATKRQRISYYVATVPTVADKGIYLRSDP
jgi:hypothetical protein